MTWGRETPGYDFAASKNPAVRSCSRSRRGWIGNQPFLDQHHAENALELHQHLETAAGTVITVIRAPN
jgi:hypothetical protein